MASGRFGVDAEYLVNADELSIKMAQGAKPGEGGQLMGKKVTTEIAEIRFAKPGTDLISPPPHHDIYSIEDLAQLIYDLKAAKPGVPVSVKLVAVENIGTIAVGVAKAGADVIEIDGIDGGTGAAMVSSKEHAGLPSEMGLAEAHQALVVNGLRKAVKLRVGGGIKNGSRRHQVRPVRGGRVQLRPGADGVGRLHRLQDRATSRTARPASPARPRSSRAIPEHTKAYLQAVAEEVRELLAAMGFKHLGEITGRSDLLVPRTDLKAEAPAGRPAGRVEVHPPGHGAGRSRRERIPQDELPGRRLCAAISFGAQPQDPRGGPRRHRHGPERRPRVPRAELATAPSGRRSPGMIARLYGREGMPNHRKIKVRLDGEAGQSFGAWCVNGLDLELRGFAQDGVAKGISGGTVVVTLDYTASDYGGEIQSVAGNNVGYGATGGTIFIGGRAGHRLGIRNSGRDDRRRGRRQVRLRVHDPRPGADPRPGRERDRQRHDRRRTVRLRSGERGAGEAARQERGGRSTAARRLRVDAPAAHQYYARTGSRQAEHILKNWAEIRRGRRLRKVLPAGRGPGDGRPEDGRNQCRLSWRRGAPAPGGVSFGAVSLCRRSAGQSGRAIPDTPSRRFL